MKKTLISIIFITSAAIQALAGLEFAGTLPGHSASVSCVKFTPDSKHIVSAGFDGLVIIHPSGSNREISSRDILKPVIINTSVPVESMDISPDGRLIATGHRDKSVKIWELQTGRLLKHIAGFPDVVFSCAFTRDSSFLAAGTKDGISLYSMKDFAKAGQVALDGAWARSICFTPDGKKMLAANARQVSVWELKEQGTVGKLLKRTGPEFMPKAALNCGLLTYAVAASPDSQFAAAAGEEGMLRMFRIEDGVMLWSSRVHEGRIWDIDFSADGAKVATAGSDRDIRISETVSSAVFTTIAGSEDEVFSVAFSPDGRYIAASGRDGKVKVWTTPFVKKPFPDTAVILLLLAAAALLLLTVFALTSRKRAA